MARSVVALSSILTTVAVGVWRGVAVEVAGLIVAGLVLIVVLVYFYSRYLAKAQGRSLRIVSKSFKMEWPPPEACPKQEVDP